jgi:hypothetical protein
VREHHISLFLGLLCPDDEAFGYSETPTNIYQFTYPDIPEGLNLG